MDKIYYRAVTLFYKFNGKIKIGKNTTFRKSFFLHVGKAGNILIGNNCFFNHGFAAYAYSSIKIGNDCIFGENVKMYDHNHKFNTSKKPIKDQGFNISPIQIGNNVWVGTNVVILKGTKIGNNCVIGAGAIISGAIPDDSIVKNGSFSIEKIRYKE